MANATTLTLHSDAAETVPAVYNPIRVSPQRTDYINRSANTAAGDSLASLGLDVGKGRKTNHVPVSLSMPIEIQVGDPTYNQFEVKDIARFEGRYILPQTMTTSQREKFAHLVRTFIDDAIVLAAVKDQEAPW